MWLILISLWMLCYFPQFVGEGWSTYDFHTTSDIYELCSHNLELEYKSCLATSLGWQLKKLISTQTPSSCVCIGSAEIREPTCRMIANTSNYQVYESVSSICIKCMNISGKEEGFVCSYSFVYIPSPASSMNSIQSEFDSFLITSLPDDITSFHCLNINGYPCPPWSCVLGAGLPSDGLWGWYGELTLEQCIDPLLNL